MLELRSVRLTVVLAAGVSVVRTIDTDRFYLEGRIWSDNASTPFGLTLGLAVVAVFDRPQEFLEQFSRRRDLGYLEDDSAGVAHHLAIKLDQPPPPRGALLLAFERRMSLQRHAASRTSTQRASDPSSFPSVTNAWMKLSSSRLRLPHCRSQSKDRPVRSPSCRRYRE